MKLKLTPVVVAATLLCTFEIAHAQSAAIEPGAWTITHKINGGPGGRDRTETICVAATDLARDPAFLMKPRSPESGRGPQCSVESLSMNGGKISYPVACKTPMGTIKGQWQGTYTARAFDLAGKMKAGFMSVKGTMTGRHTGACRSQ